MKIKGVISGLYFNTKEKDSNGNFIQPVMMLESEGEKKRIYFPKSQKESLNVPGQPEELKKGDLVEITDIKESAGFLRGEEINVKVVGVDRRKKTVKNTDDKQMSIWKGQALNLAYSRAVEDQLFDNPDEEEVKAEIFKNAQEALELIQEWQS